MYASHYKTHASFLSRVLVCMSRPVAGQGTLDGHHSCAQLFGSDGLPLNHSVVSEWLPVMQAMPSHKMTLSSEVCILCLTAQRHGNICVATSSYPISVLRLTPTLATQLPLEHSRLP